MGGGDRMFLSSKVCKKTEVQQRRQPHSKPPFTLSQVKKAIPPHCFHRSLVRSSSYLVVDLTLSFLFYYIATTFFHRLPHPLPYLAWPTYWALQGSLLPGLWVIGHECGHHAFSDYRWLNHSVGLVLHTALLWPYFSGRISHHKHHSNTGSIERDELFLPRPYSETSWHLKHLNNPPGRFLTLATTLLLGYPLYLTFNVSGRNYGRFASHYDPFSPIFSEQERVSVFVSDLAILAAIFGLYKLAASKGLTWLVCVYGVPMMVFYALMVLLTYLQHTHSSLPYYDSSEWEWLRGELVTVDRDWGILNRVFHHITDTHVVHHLFPAIPHYHAVEATVAARPVLGDYYKFDDTPILRALWREAGECLYVELDRGQGVYWYRNCN